MRRLFLVLSPVFFLLAMCVENASAQTTACGQNLTPLFGLTTESIDDVDKLIKALDQIKSQCVPTLRVVFQPKVNLEQYAAALEKIRGTGPMPKHAYIMGLLVDSDHFHKYEEPQMRQRARDYAARLHEYVDVWEAGNELNGDWVGWPDEAQNSAGARKLEAMRRSVGQRVWATYNEITKIYRSKNKTPKFALNLYFNDDNISMRMKEGKYTGENCRNSDLRDCGEECRHDYEMFTWSRKYLKEFKMKFDYVLFSYYRDDCCNVPTHAELWARVFEQLSREFTIRDEAENRTYKPLVGFGEVAPQCYCMKNEDGNREQDDDLRRLATCCRPEQARYVQDYYETLHSDIKTELAKLPAATRPNYVGGFFYWYFYQDATDGSEDSVKVLQAFVQAATAWK